MEHASTPNDVSREAVLALAEYVELLLRWNVRLNLIAHRDKLKIWDRHIADSLQLAGLMEPRPDRAVDLGSGAGFPGLVLSLATGVPFDLIEADQRKAAFLREAARVTKAPVQIHPVRVEAAAIAPAPLVTARALAPLPKLLGLAAPLLAPGGTCLFLKGANASAELTHAATEWHMQVETLPSRTAPGSCILRITDLSRVASKV